LLQVDCLKKVCLRVYLSVSVYTYIKTDFQSGNVKYASKEFTDWL